MTHHHRKLGLFSAITIGLAAMFGTGVFAAWTPAGKLADSWLLVALAIAAVIATLNAISNARLARIFPDSGGAYLYGKECLGPTAGQIAGWSFMFGKTASASAAALVIGAYLTPSVPRLTALAAITIIFIVNVSGLKYSIAVMGALLILVTGVLAALIVVGYSTPAREFAVELPVSSSSVVQVFAAAGILFVAFAGYARVSVLGSEVRKARTNIPLAIGVGLAIVTVIYFLIAGVLQKFPQALDSQTPLQELALLVGLPIGVVSIGATCAAGAALFALIAGIARMMVTMSEGGHLPRMIGARHGSKGVPVRAEAVVAVIVAFVTLLGGIGLSLGLSGFFILVYYGVAHIASMRRSGNPIMRFAVTGIGLVANSAVVLALFLVAVGTRA